MARQFYFDSQFGIESYAMTEDGVLCDCRCEHVENGAVIGNIYKGRVTDVLNGMQAAFVDCGLDKHCYISVNDLVPERLGVDGEVDIPATLNLHEGDEIMVQVTKTAQGKKGAKVTTNLSFVGRYYVYMPTTPFVGISAKISDHELRKNLTFGAKNLLNEGEGLIVRTAAPYAVMRDKRVEIDYFRRLYANILARFEHAPVGELLYSDSPLHMRVLRDIIFAAGDEIHVGTKALYDSVKEMLSVSSNQGRITVTAHEPGLDMMYSEGITAQVLKSIKPKVELSNGAHLIIESTEALTVIDVNTGKFTGDDSLEQTVYSTNVLAAQEIARQVKLRNLGGIFVVDFIDMTEENHRKAIVQELERALKKDGGRCKVLPMSKFGLVEFTRKRTGSTTAESIVVPCKYCEGTAAVRSHESILTEFRAKLFEVLHSGASTVCADINYDLANALFANSAMKQNIAAIYPEARVYIISHRTYKEDCMYFRKVDSKNFALPEGTVLLY